MAKPLAGLQPGRVARFCGVFAGPPPGYQFEAGARKDPPGRFPVGRPGRGVSRAENGHGEWSTLVFQQGQGSEQPGRRRSSARRMAQHPGAAGMKGPGRSNLESGAMTNRRPDPVRTDQGRRAYADEVLRAAAAPELRPDPAGQGKQAALWELSFAPGRGRPAKELRPGGGPAGSRTPRGTGQTRPCRPRSSTTAGTSFAPRTTIRRIRGKLATPASERHPRAKLGGAPCPHRPHPRAEPPPLHRVKARTASAAVNRQQRGQPRADGTPTTNLGSRPRPGQAIPAPDNPP